MDNVLGLHDTPHRIALGVGLGFLVGMTPTLGFQMVIYFAIAAVVRANKVSGILPIWLSNPITAVPLYYGNWLLGRLLMTGSLSGSEKGRAAVQGVLDIANAAQEPLWRRMFSAEFWSAAVHMLAELGLELWVGSLTVGSVLGLAFYWVTLRMVRRMRARAAHDLP